MDGTGDFDFMDKRELRSNRSQFEKIPAKEERYLTKVHFWSNNDEQDKLKEISKSLPDDGCGENWNEHVSYSLKKKGRWGLVNDFRSNIEDWNDYDYYDGTEVPTKPVISVLERCRAWTQRKNRSPSCLAFHTMEREDGDLVPVHRYPNHTYGNESTLITKAKDPKPKKTPKVYRSRNDRRPIHPPIAEDAPTEPPRSGFQYEISSFRDQKKFENLNLLMKKGKRSVRKHRQNVFPAGYTDWMLEDDDFEFDQSEDEAVEEEDEIVKESPKTDQPDQSDKSSESTDFVLEGFEEIDGTADTDRSLSVNLIDLAELQRAIQADARSQKRRQRQNRRRYHTETSVSFYQDESIDDVAGPSGVTKTSSFTDEVPKNQVVSHLLSDDYFEIIPTDVLCASETIAETHLRKIYGDAYYECSCVPRRFVIDVGSKVKESLESIFGEECAHLDIRMVCVCEVIPPTVLVAILDEDERATTAPVKIWINGTFSRNVQATFVDTINPCIPQTIEQVIDGVVKMTSTLPLEHFHREQRSALTVDSVRQAPSRLFLNPSSKFLERSQATAEVLEQENIFKKLQRQITAVARYDWYSNIGESVCGICLDWPVEEVGFCLSECRHWFCTKCWRSYCTERILNGWGPLTCPYPKCTSSVDYYTLTTFVPLPICQTYSEQLRDQCIRKNWKQWTWCPNVKCGRLIRLAQDSSIPAQACVCGYFWCTECSSASHWPASCEHAKLYLDKLKVRQDDPTLLDTFSFEKRINVVDVKRCPHCKILMEKGEGCICMTCRCGKLFCWGCGGPWMDNNHGSCYQIKTIQGFLKVRLVDVGGAYGSNLREIFYERALAHRMATRSAYMSKLKQAMLSKCWNTPKRILRLPSVAEEENGKSTNLDENRLKKRMAAVSNHMQRFFEIHRQAHYLLEFIYVHMQFCNRRSYHHLEGVRFAVDRLEFALDRMEEACKAGDLRKVDEFMERVKVLLQELVKEICSVKFVKTDNNGGRQS